MSDKDENGWKPLHDRTDEQERFIAQMVQAAEPTPETVEALKVRLDEESTKRLHFESLCAIMQPVVDAVFACKEAVQRGYKSSVIESKQLTLELAMDAYTREMNARKPSALAKAVLSLPVIPVTSAEIFCGTPVPAPATSNSQTNLTGDLSRHTNFQLLPPKDKKR